MSGDCWYCEHGITHPEPPSAAERWRERAVTAVMVVGSVGLAVAALRRSPDVLRTVAGPSAVSAALRSCGGSS